LSELELTELEHAPIELGLVGGNHLKNCL